MKFLSVCLLFVCTTCFAQGGYKQKLYHYIERKATQEDTITTHFIYVEMLKDSVPIWQTAFIDRSIYTVHAERVETTPLIVGTNKSNQRKVTITPKEGNTLWKLELDLEQQSGGDEHVKAVVLKGMYKNTKVSCTVSRAIELEAMP